MEDAKLASQSKKADKSAQSAEDGGKFEETPASPDPIVSPDSGCQILPIIIPTERSVDFIENKSDSELSSSKIPVITITDRTSAINLSSDSNQSDDVVFTEWDMLEESQRNNTKTRAGDWQSSLATSSGHDVAGAAMLVSSSLPQNNNDSRGYSMSSRANNIPTVPVPSLGGSRRLSSVLEKSKVLSNLDISIVTQSESPVNVPEARLKSPDPEILFSRSKVLSPRSKDSHNTPKTPTKTPMPLLVSPPPISTEPPLSMEDLEELLGGSGDEKKSDKSARYHKKDSGSKQEANLTKDKVSKEQAYSDSERQWEEVDKHIIKLGGRKCAPNAERDQTSSVINAASAMIAKIESKSSEIKCLPDHRSPPSAASKFEPRYADNYERHPRQRDAPHENMAKEKPAENSCRDQEVSQIPVLHSAGPSKADERIGVPLYKRRPSSSMDGWKDVISSRPDNEFDGNDYYNVRQVPWQPPMTAADHPFGNSQWKAANYSGIANPPMPPPPSFPHSMGMFMGGSPVDPSHAAPGSRPLLNPAARPLPDVSHAARPENIRADDIPPLMSSAVFPPQYRPYQMGQGPYDPNFDRSTDYPHVRPMWVEATAGRVVEPSYNKDNVIPCGIGIVDNSTGASYPRTETPCPWPRDRSRGGRGRGRESYYNERNRTEARPSFNRDVRRPDRPRDSHADRENPSRFNRDNRSAFERDPRIRMEHSVTVQAKESGNSGGNSCGSARDPRLAKDKHFSPTKVKDPAHNDRDPRKRSMPPPLSPSTATKKTTSNKEKSKSQKLPEKRADSDSSKEKTADKLPKADKMQSPLESLYGVIDTKLSHSGGLQKFKIPKIKRPEPPSPLPSSTTSHVVGATKEAAGVTSKPSRTKSDGKKKSGNLSSLSEHSDDAIAEVSSTSNNTMDNSDATVSTRQDELTKEVEVISSLVEQTSSKKKTRITAVDSATIDIKSMKIMDKSGKDESEADGAKPKEEVTQELIEALIRKSFECGEGKKLVEHAKLIQKLGEALQAKKLKKIQKIIESESESSSSDKEETIGPRKTQTRKKRRVIVSDSSDDECLAERLGILSTSVEANDEKASATSTAAPDSTKDSPTNQAAAYDDKELVQSAEKKNDNLSEGLGSEKSNVQTDDCGEIRESEANDEQNDVTMRRRYADGDNQKNDLPSEDSLGKESDRLEDNHERINTRSESNKRRDSQLEDGTKKEEEEEAEDRRVNVDEAPANEKAPDTQESLDKDETDKTECCKVADDTVPSDKSKSKTKRRNSLEMLQDDIRDMFISDDVVTATGFRMCRLSKENQPSPTPTLTGSKKDEVSHASVAEVSTETDEPVASNAKAKKATSKVRNSGEAAKVKTKSKKDVVQRSTRKLRSKEFVPSSDSEEDQPLALRTEWKVSNVNNSNNATPKPEEEDEESSESPLRRSKRATRKEPRVLVEKVDITKLDPSKMMFDSSSDESFSIDVSELAAAVDISLRPDKQSDQESVDTVVSLKPQRKIAKNTSRRSLKSKKKNASLLTDYKSDDGMSFTDEESVISDISMSSSTTAGKRRSTIKTAAKEELLSNILVGLVQTTTEKTTVDKDGEADVDEDSNCPSLMSIETNVKKASVKKKKKKFNWKLGILSKKKRRKGASAASIKVECEEMSSEATNIVEDDGASVADDNKATVADNEIVKEATDTPLTKGDASVESVLKCDDAIEQSANTDNPDVAVEQQAESSNRTVLSEPSNATEGTLSNESLDLSTEKRKPALKTEEKEDTTEAKTERVEAQSEIEAEQEEKEATSTTFVTAHSTDIVATKVPKAASSKIVYDELMEEVFRRTKVEQITKYAWTGPNQLYNCLLCFFTGKNIVHHYKISHPEKEILAARFTPANAKAAIEAAIKDDETSTSTFPTTVTDRMCKYRCRFCCFETEGAAIIALEAFYDHCTTHTGEYRFHCNNCPYQAVAKSSMRTHYYKMCRKLNNTFHESTYEDPIPWQNLNVYGYLCRECNFVQLKRENVVSHAAFWHRKQTEPKILRINMSALVVNDARTDDKAAAASEPLAEEIKEENSKSEVVEEDAASKNDVAPIAEIADATVVSEATESRGRSDNEDEKSSSEPHEESKAEEEEKNNGEVKRKETDVRPSAIQGEAEGPVNAGKMSAFVCPPELENKEVEIQLERKKRMQEIVDNIGIKINKNLSSLSIIDKLQDKMRTDAVVVSPVGENNDESSTNVSLQEDNEALAPVAAADSTVDSSNLEADVVIKKDPLSLSTTDLQEKNPLSASQSEVVDSSNVDKTELKIRDPLAIIDPCKNSESDIEISDNEAMRCSPVFESDSSSEQSDSEPTDVNMILKETSSINASSSRDPMLTTIQRLVAQLQSVKPPLEVPAAEDVTVKSESVSTTTTTSFPKAPNVISIDCAKYSLLQQNVRRDGEAPSPSSGEENPPKNFLRLRRLSGDMLSIPASLDNQEDVRTAAIGGCLRRDDGSLPIICFFICKRAILIILYNIIKDIDNNNNNEEGERGKKLYRDNYVRKCKWVY